eukprot:2059803-Pyramimonas_sp.AAC.1
MISWSGGFNTSHVVKNRALAAYILKNRAEHGRRKKSKANNEQFCRAPSLTGSILQCSLFFLCRAPSLYGPILPCSWPFS